MTRFRAFLSALTLASATALTVPAAAQAQQDDVMIVFDGSNSMWGQIDGVAKIEIARGVMKNLLGEWTADRKVGLMAYGHRKRGDCGDIEVLIEPAAGTAAEIQKRIDAITPTGKTPLTDAVEMAARELSYTDRPATVVLISDGLESCGRDPCDLARTLEKGGVGFTAHVVGFGLGGDEDAASLACIAEETGGQYFSASNADELSAALSALSTAVAKTPKPEPEPEPELPAVTLSAPETALVGSLVEVGWDKSFAENDFVTIVAPETDQGDHGNYVRVHDGMTGKLRVPAQTGLYELRYILNEGSEILGRRMIELVDPEITLDAPDMVLTGEVFDVSWTGAVDEVDFIAIVAMGAEEGSYQNYVRVRDVQKESLQAPAEPGMYELRYVLNEGRRTMATRPIEVTEPEITLDAPATALTGEKFRVSWTGAVDSRDYITIVPVGTEDGKDGNYIRVGDNQRDDLQAPAETGMYELRYVLNEGRRVMVRRPIEITEPEVTLEGPDTALTGERFRVGWTGTVDRNDYITIVPMGAEEGESGNYIRVSDNQQDDLQAPAETGMYELRYVLNEGRRTMASRPIEITEPEVTLEGPDTALTGERFRVGWTGTVDRNDYITIVPMGAEEGESGNYIRVSDNQQDDLQAPAETGMYELRYVLNEGRRTMASRPIEITEPEVTLEGPAEIRAGDRIRVTWTGTVDRNDYVMIVPAGSADDASGTYIRVGEETEGELAAPDETGLYELRYVLNEGRRVLARHPIEVLAADAALESGASLTAPDSAPAGSTIEVGWSVESASADQRITLARADQAIFTWITAVKVTDAPPIQMPVPQEPGVYELRFLDLAGQAVLARKVITVE